MTLHQFRTHPEYVEGCFGCKVAYVGHMGCTPTRSIGAGRSDRDLQKKWDKELDLYRSARKQGIQPASTGTRDIRRAIDASNTVGAAYDAGTRTFGEAV